LLSIICIVVAIITEASRKFLISNLASKSSYLTISPLDICSTNILAKFPNPDDPRIRKHVFAHDVEVWGLPLEHKDFSWPLWYCQSEPLPFFELGGSMDDISVCLADYSSGNAFPIYLSNYRNTGFDTCAATPNYEGERAEHTYYPTTRSPESILEYRWNTNTDTWAIGLLVRHEPIAMP
jgi:serine/threonine-protein kinase SRPK3